MKLIDRISLNRAVSLILGFIISMIKIFAPNKIEDNNPSPKPLRRKRLRKDE